jgi:hypothetical protein
VVQGYRRDSVTHVIRVDDDIYQWLQSQAKPFEDTPNTVLRNLMGQMEPTPTPGTLQEASTSGTTVGVRKEGRTGQKLNVAWGVGAKHPLFHKDGHWYEHLSEFPGALFDDHGYVVFKDEATYRSTPQLRFGKKVNVDGGISSLPGYVNVE